MLSQKRKFALAASICVGCICVGIDTHWRVGAQECSTGYEYKRVRAKKHMTSIYVGAWIDLRR